MRGDADCNGDVNVLDAVIIARMVGEDSTLNADEESKANAELDGVLGVTANDLNLLLNYLAKKTETL